MIQKPLISIIVLSYKNYNYIYQCIDSILSQNYPNIEIIVTNDGSLDFDKTAVENYIKKNSNKNIKRFLINNNIKNIGTVKNINKGIKFSTGDYITLLAADDTLYNEKVFSRYIDAFNELPSKELIVVSQLGMYDIKLKKLICLFISEENKEKIINLKPKKLFAEMATKCILPGPSICYKRKLFEKYGYFDEKYVLVEDYSSELKLSRLGVRYNYFNFISAKHRDGGISHGNLNGESHKNKQYDLDILNIFKHEVLPHTNLLDNQQKKLFLRRLKEQVWTYSYKYNYKNGTKEERRNFVKKNIRTMIFSFLNKIYKDIKEQLKGKKFIMLIIGFIFLSTYIFNIDLGSSLLSIFNISTISNPSEIINKLIGQIGILFIVVPIILSIYLFIKKYILEIYKFIKFIF